MKTYSVYRADPVQNDVPIGDVMFTGSKDDALKVARRCWEQKQVPYCVIESSHLCIGGFGWESDDE